MTENSAENFRPRFLRLATVNIVSNIMVPLAGLVDTAFLGHLPEIRYLAGAALASILFNLIYRTCRFLRMATTGPTAQAEGRSDPDAVLLTLLRNGAIALGLGLIFLLLQYPIGEIGFSLLDATPDLKEAAKDYYNARIWGAPAVLLNMVMMGWFLGREQNSKVLVMSMVGNIGNIILDYVFIMEWGWAGAGAGGATAASQYMTLLCGIIYFVLENWWSHIQIVAPQVFQWEEMKSTLKLNTDIWLRTVGNVLVIVAFTELSASMGTMVLATNALLIQVVNITFFLIEGLSFATESLAGNFRGQGTNEQLFPLVKLAGFTSLAIGLSITSIFIILPEPLFGLLTNHEDVIEKVTHYILWLLPVLIFASQAFMLDGYYLGLTEGVILRNSVLAAGAIGFLPVAGTAWWLENTHVLWLALCLYMAIRAVLLAVGVPATINSENEMPIALNSERQVTE